MSIENAGELFAQAADRPDAMGLFLTVATRTRLVLLVNDLIQFGGALLIIVAAARGVTPDELAASWFDHRETAETGGATP